ncbi:hypothetical protein [Anaerobium acetethylicum]|uniref:DUF4230 domain-containing protein n=1 Tax=Anaerobium acetethylicum TaxID=1619234 RepID=A0A1D3TUN2_9FIRM|nr:hypothetical protein [Anaerobium acetethylicum]SCP97781.1 hypothetical protein SAMN05421730_101385 [Anaerobium acetethylicum]
MNKSRKPKYMIFAIVAALVLWGLCLISIHNEIVLNKEKSKITMVQAVDKSIEISNERYDYTDIVTNYNAEWLGGIKSEKMLVKFSGSIVAACKLKDVKIKKDKVEVVLSKAFIKSNTVKDIEKTSYKKSLGFLEWSDTNDNTLDNHLVEQEKQKIESRVSQELLAKVEDRSKETISMALENLEIRQKKIKISFE